MPDKTGYQPAQTEPRLFYGYVVVVVAFFIMVVSWALYYSFGVFFKPLLNDFGWTHAMTSGAFSLSMTVYGVLGVVVGVLNDRFGPRVVLTLCGLLLGLGHLLMSQVSALWQMYLFYGLIVGTGMSGVWVPQLSTVARWFVGRRTLMTGIVLAGVSMGQLIGPPVITQLIAVYGWRLSYIMLGGAVLLVVVLLAQFMRRDPTQMGQLPYGAEQGKEVELSPDTQSFSLREAAYTAQFWLVFGIFFCFGFGVFAIAVHIVPHAIELGISATSAATILSCRGGMSLVGNNVLGGAADRIGNRQIFVFGFIMILAAFFWLVPASELWMLYLFAVIFGFAGGGMGASESPLVAGLFGLTSHGLIYGVIHLGFTAGAAVGPVVTGYIFDLTRGYRAAFLVCAAFSIAGIVLAALLKPTRRPHGRI